jgi:hypothetical protein
MLRLLKLRSLWLMEIRLMVLLLLPLLLLGGGGAVAACNKMAVGKKAAGRKNAAASHPGDVQLEKTQVLVPIGTSSQVSMCIAYTCAAYVQNASTASIFMCSMHAECMYAHLHTSLWHTYCMCAGFMYANGTQNAHIQCRPYNACTLHSFCSHAQFLACSTLFAHMQNVVIIYAKHMQHICMLRSKMCVLVCRIFVRVCMTGQVFTQHVFVRARLKASRRNWRMLLAVMTS